MEVGKGQTRITFPHMFPYDDIDEDDDCEDNPFVIALDEADHDELDGGDGSQQFKSGENPSIFPEGMGIAVDMSLPGKVRSDYNVASKSGTSTSSWHVPERRLSSDDQPLDCTIKAVTKTDVCSDPKEGTEKSVLTSVKGKDAPSLPNFLLSSPEIIRRLKSTLINNSSSSISDSKTLPCPKSPSASSYPMKAVRHCIQKENEAKRCLDFNSKDSGHVTGNERQLTSSQRHQVEKLTKCLKASHGQQKQIATSSKVKITSTNNCSSLASVSNNLTTSHQGISFQAVKHMDSVNNDPSYKIPINDSTEKLLRSINENPLLVNILDAGDENTNDVQNKKSQAQNSRNSDKSRKREVPKSKPQPSNSRNTSNVQTEMDAEYISIVGKRLGLTRGFFESYNPDLRVVLSRAHKVDLSNPDKVSIELVNNHCLGDMNNLTDLLPSKNSVTEPYGANPTLHKMGTNQTSAHSDAVDYLTKMITAHFEKSQAKDNVTTLQSGGNSNPSLPPAKQLPFLRMPVSNVLQPKASDSHPLNVNLLSSKVKRSSSHSAVQDNHTVQVQPLISSIPPPPPLIRCPIALVPTNGFKAVAPIRIETESTEPEIFQEEPRETLILPLHVDDTSNDQSKLQRNQNAAVCDIDQVLDWTSDIFTFSSSNDLSPVNIDSHSETEISKEFASPSQKDHEKVLRPNTSISLNNPTNNIPLSRTSIDNSVALSTSLSNMKRSDSSKIKDKCVTQLADTDKELPSFPVVLRVNLSSSPKTQPTITSTSSISNSDKTKHISQTKLSVSSLSHTALPGSIPSQFVRPAALTMSAGQKQPSTKVDLISSSSVPLTFQRSSHANSSKSSGSLTTLPSYVLINSNDPILISSKSLSSMSSKSATYPTMINSSSNPILVPLNLSCISSQPTTKSSSNPTWVPVTTISCVSNQPTTTKSSSNPRLVPSSKGLSTISSQSETIRSSSNPRLVPSSKGLSTVSSQSETIRSSSNPRLVPSSKGLSTISSQYETIRSFSNPRLVPSSKGLSTISSQSAAIRSSSSNMRVIPPKDPCILSCSNPSSAMMFSPALLETTSTSFPSMSLSTSGLSKSSVSSSATTLSSSSSSVSVNGLKLKFRLNEKKCNALNAEYKCDQNKEFIPITDAITNFSDNSLQGSKNSVKAVHSSMSRAETAEEMFQRFQEQAMKEVYNAQFGVGDVSRSLRPTRCNISFVDRSMPDLKKKKPSDENKSNVLSKNCNQSTTLPTGTKISMETTKKLIKNRHFSSDSRSDISKEEIPTEDINSYPRMREDNSILIKKTIHTPNIMAGHKVFVKFNVFSNPQSGRCFLAPFFNLGGSRVQFDTEDMEYFKKAVIEREKEDRMCARHLIYYCREGKKASFMRKENLAQTAELTDTSYKKCSYILEGFSREPTQKKIVPPREEWKVDNKVSIEIDTAEVDDNIVIDFDNSVNTALSCSVGSVTSINKNDEVSQVPTDSKNMKSIIGFDSDVPIQEKMLDTCNDQVADSTFVEQSILEIGKSNTSCATEVQSQNNDKTISSLGSEKSGSRIQSPSKLRPNILRKSTAVKLRKTGGSSESLCKVSQSGISSEIHSSPVSETSYTDQLKELFTSGILQKTISPLGKPSCPEKEKLGNDGPDDLMNSGVIQIKNEVVDMEYNKSDLHSHASATNPSLTDFKKPMHVSLSTMQIKNEPVDDYFCSVEKDLQLPNSISQGNDLEKETTETMHAVKNVSHDMNVASTTDSSNGKCIEESNKHDMNAAGATDSSNGKCIEEGNKIEFSSNSSHSDSADETVSCDSDSLPLSSSISESSDIASSSCIDTSDDESDSHFDSDMLPTPVLSSSTLSFTSCPNDSSLLSGENMPPNPVNTKITSLVESLKERLNQNTLSLPPVFSEPVIQPKVKVGKRKSKSERDRNKFGKHLSLNDLDDGFKKSAVSLLPNETAATPNSQNENNAVEKVSTKLFFDSPSVPIDRSSVSSVICMPVSTSKEALNSIAGSSSVLMTSTQLQIESVPAVKEYETEFTSNLPENLLKRESKENSLSSEYVNETRDHIDQSRHANTVMKPLNQSLLNVEKTKAAQTGIKGVSDRSLSETIDVKEHTPTTHHDEISFSDAADDSCESEIDVGIEYVIPEIPSTKSCVSNRFLSAPPLSVSANGQKHLKDFTRENEFTSPLLNLEIEPISQTIVTSPKKFTLPLRPRIKTKKVKPKSPEITSKPSVASILCQKLDISVDPIKPKLKGKLITPLECDFNVDASPTNPDIVAMAVTPKVSSPKPINPGFKPSINAIFGVEDIPTSIDSMINTTIPSGSKLNIAKIECGTKSNKRQVAKKATSKRTPSKISHPQKWKGGGEQNENELKKTDNQILEALSEKISQKLKDKPGKSEVTKRKLRDKICGKSEVATLDMKDKSKADTKISDWYSEELRKLHQANRYKSLRKFAWRKLSKEQAKTEDICVSVGPVVAVGSDTSKKEVKIDNVSKNYTIENLELTIPCKVMICRLEDRTWGPCGGPVKTETGSYNVGYLLKEEEEKEKKKQERISEMNRRRRKKSVLKKVKKNKQQNKPKKDIIDFYAAAIESLRKKALMLEEDEKKNAARKEAENQVVIKKEPIEVGMSTGKQIMAEAGDAENAIDNDDPDECIVFEPLTEQKELGAGSSLVIEENVMIGSRKAVSIVERNYEGELIHILRVTLQDNDDLEETSYNAMEDCNTDSDNGSSEEASRNVPYDFTKEKNNETFNGIQDLDEEHAVDAVHDDTLKASEKSENDNDIMRDLQNHDENEKNVVEGLRKCDKATRNDIATDIMKPDVEKEIGILTNVEKPDQDPKNTERTYNEDTDNLMDKLNGNSNVVCSPKKLKESLTGSNNTLNQIRESDINKVDGRNDGALHDDESPNVESNLACSSTEMQKPDLILQSSETVTAEHDALKEPTVVSDDDTFFHKDIVLGFEDELGADTVLSKLGPGDTDDLFLLDDGDEVENIGFIPDEEVERLLGLDVKNGDDVSVVNRGNNKTAENSNEQMTSKLSWTMLACSRNERDKLEDKKIKDSNQSKIQQNKASCGQTEKLNDTAVDLMESYQVQDLLSISTDVDASDRSNFPGRANAKSASVSPSWKRILGSQALKEIEESVNRDLNTNTKTNCGRANNAIIDVENKHGAQDLLSISTDVDASDRSTSPDRLNTNAKSTSISPSWKRILGSQALKEIKESVNRDLNTNTLGVTEGPKTIQMNINKKNSSNADKLKLKLCSGALSRALKLSAQMRKTLSDPKSAKGGEEKTESTTNTPQTGSSSPMTLDINVKNENLGTKVLNQEAKKRPHDDDTNRSSDMQNEIIDMMKLPKSQGAATSDTISKSKKFKSDSRIIPQSVPDKTKISQGDTSGVIHHKSEDSTIRMSGASQSTAMNKMQETNDKNILKVIGSKSKTFDLTKLKMKLTLKPQMATRINKPTLVPNRLETENGINKARTQESTKIVQESNHSGERNYKVSNLSGNNIEDTEKLNKSKMALTCKVRTPNIPPLLNKEKLSNILKKFMKPAGSSIPTDNVSKELPPDPSNSNESEPHSRAKSEQNSSPRKRTRQPRKIELIESKRARVSNGTQQQSEPVVSEDKVAGTEERSCFDCLSELKPELWNKT